MDVISETIDGLCKKIIEQRDRIKELEKALREAERVRDEWCAEYVRLRDCRKST